MTTIGITASRMWWEEAQKTTYTIEINPQAEWPYRSDPNDLPPEIRRALWVWLDTAEEKR